MVQGYDVLSICKSKSTVRLAHLSVPLILSILCMNKNKGGFSNEI